MMRKKFRSKFAGLVGKHPDLAKALGVIIFGAAIPLVIYFLGGNLGFLNPERANTAVSFAIIATYPLVMYWPEVSLVAAMGEHLRQDKSWSGKNSEEARSQARSLIPVSGTVAGISLATIALATRFANRNQLEDFNAVFGVALMLFSSILLFWSLGMWFTASVPIRADASEPEKDVFPQLNAVAARQGYWLITLGIYTYFLGLVWVLSPLNLWFTLVGALTYFIAFWLVILRPFRSLRRLRSKLPWKIADTKARVKFQDVLHISWNLRVDCLV